MIDAWGKLKLKDGIVEVPFFIKWHTWEKATPDQIREIKQKTNCMIKNIEKRIRKRAAELILQHAEKEEVTLVDKLYAQLIYFDKKGKRGGFVGKELGKFVLPEVKDSGMYLCFGIEEHKSYFFVRNAIKVTASSEVSTIHDFKCKSDFPATAIVDGEEIKLDPFTEWKTGDYITKIGDRLYMVDEVFFGFGSATHYKRSIVATRPAQIKYK